MLEERFVPGTPCLFEWFTFAKDELFCDPDNCNEYSREFLASSSEDYDSIIHVQNYTELHSLLDELYSTALLRGEDEPVTCMICFS